MSCHRHIHAQAQQVTANISGLHAAAGEVRERLLKKKVLPVAGMIVALPMKCQLLSAAMFVHVVDHQWMYN